MYRTNCSGSGRSNPYCARNVSRTLSLTFGLSITALKGSPGARWMSANVIAATNATITAA
jgi:hypothetical protein